MGWTEIYRGRVTTTEEAVKAVANLPDDAKMKLEDRIKLALQYLGSK